MEGKDFCPKLRRNASESVEDSKSVPRVVTDESRDEISGAWARGEIPSEGDSDYIDASVIDHVEKIQKNPHIVTTGSCSGGKHSGYPFISFVAADDEGKKYAQTLKKMGYAVVKSGKTRMGWFKNFPECEIAEEWSVGTNKRVSPEKAKKIWGDFAEILGDPRE